jgi:hypothetical protein
MRNYLLPSLGTVALLSASSLAIAQSDAHPCASILPPAERLACYDEAFGAPAAEAQSIATTEQARELFGLSGKETQERLPEPMRVPTVDEIEGTITKISIDGRGGRVLTLDNGQVWQITEVTRRGPTQVGDVVQVRKGALGSHNLVTAAGIGLKARRVK